MNLRIIIILFVLLAQQGNAQKLGVNTPTPDPLKGLSNRTSTSYMQIVNYKWHVRGGLAGINLDGSGNANPNSDENDLFAYKLEYETAGQWSGNIGKQTWSHKKPSPPADTRSYTFSYDGLSRLTAASYSGLTGESFGLPLVSYDKNGNIRALQRNGKMGGSHGLMDNLTYTYSGNRLSAVNDAVSGEYEVDFVKRGGGTYGYHVNGALNSDENEKISSITYNTVLNLPEQVNLNDGRWIKYTYDGAGTLLKTEYSNGEYWEYVEGVVFKNGQPFQMAIPEGRAVYESSQWKLEYDIKDHLGNTRVSFREGVGGAELKAKTDFDPWGVRLNGTGVVNGFQNRWELQGHEKEMTFNLNRVNFGARVYNPTIGRFDRVDPLAEVQPNKTPYHFVSNNPITRVDPTGMLDHEYDKDGNKISDLGGDKIDFHHQANGDTKIVDKQTGASNIIAGGEALIRGYTQRDNSTGWGTLFYEWDQGTGPTKSMFADFDNTTTGVFGSFDRTFSVYAGKARADVMNGGADKGRVNFSYGDINPLTAGLDGWEQFIGRANLSYNKLGDKVLYMMNDSKSMTSFLYRMSPSWERSDFRLNGNTYQTYIWTETMQEVQNKNQIRVDYINQLQKARQEYRNTEHQRLPAIKW